MAVYTEVTDGEVHALFAKLGLSAPQSIRGIAGGIENTNYFADTEADEYVITIFERLNSEDLHYYLYLMQHLADQGLPVPRPIVDEGGAILQTLRGRPVVVVNKLPGMSVTVPSASDCRSLGEMLAKMHLSGADYPRHQPNPRGLQWWEATAPVVNAFMAHEQQSLLHSELHFQKHIAASPLYAALPKGPVHADLFRDNALVSDGKVTGIIDFYFAGHDAFLFDIAVCLNDWCVDADTGFQDEATAVALLDGYQSIRRLRPAEQGLLPAMRRAGALRFWLSRLQDLHLPRDAKLLSPHDPTCFERMLRAMRGEAHWAEN